MVKVKGNWKWQLVVNRMQSETCCVRSHPSATTCSEEVSQQCNSVTIFIRRPDDGDGQENMKRDIFSAFEPRFWGIKKNGKVIHYKSYIQHGNKGTCSNMMEVSKINHSFYEQMLENFKTNTNTVQVINVLFLFWVLHLLTDYLKSVEPVSQSDQLRVRTTR